MISQRIQFICLTLCECAWIPLHQFALVIYYAIVVPVRISFDIEPRDTTSEHVLTAFFFLDMVSAEIRVQILLLIHLPAGFQFQHGDPEEVWPGECVEDALSPEMRAVRRRPTSLDARPRRGRLREV